MKVDVKVSFLATTTYLFKRIFCLTSSFVNLSIEEVISEYSSVVFEVLEDGLIPAQIWKKARKINYKISRNNVSDILKEFREQGIVECINANQLYLKVYFVHVDTAT